MADDDSQHDDAGEHDDDLDPSDDAGTDDGDQDEADDDTSEGDGGATDDWTPPTKEEWEKLQNTRKALRRDLAEARKAAKGRRRTPRPQRKQAAQPPAADSNGRADTDDDDREREPASAQFEDYDDGPDEAEAERVRLVTVRAGAVGALLAAGFQGDRKAAKGMAKLMDLSGIEPDDDGDVDDDDLADAIETVKDQYPQMFEQPPERRAPARRPTTADRGARSDRRPPSTDPTKRTSQRLLKQWRGA